MKVKLFTVGALQTNCYIVINQNDCFVIDPGAQGNKLYHYLNDNQLEVKAILLTHGHFDHIGAVDYLYQKYQCPIYIHEEDLAMLNDPATNLSIYEHPLTVKAPVIKAPSVLTLADCKIKWLHLPGHCPGCSMLHIIDDGIIFSGDVLFNGSIGRFDFPNSSKHDTIVSLQKIADYDFDAIVYPGHGPSTTLKQELLTNPYLQSRKF